MKTPKNRPQISGNRLALTGAVLYLLEWVAILGSGLVGVETIGGAVDASPEEAVAGYAGTETGMTLIAAWVGIALTGRVLLIVGLRAGLRDSGRDHPVMGFAVPVMGISVALEVTALTLYTGAAQVAAGSSGQAVLALDRAGTAMVPVVTGLAGLSVLCAAWCLLRSQLFPAALIILGFIGGAGMFVTPFLTAPVLEPVLAVLGFTTLFFWAWMVWAGILLWRHAPAPARKPADAMAA